MAVCRKALRRAAACAINATLLFLKNAEAVLTHDLVGLLERFRKDVEESSNPLAAEEHAAAVFVGFHRVLHARFGKHGLQAESLLQLLGDVDQVHLTVFEKLGVPAHSASILSRSDIFRP